MSSESTGCRKLSETLTILSRKRATGKLLINYQEQNWELFFFQGQLLFATGGLHRNRRWYRALQQNSINIQFNTQIVTVKELWEYQLLQDGIIHNQLTLSQGKGIIASIIAEIFFSLVAGQFDFSRNWERYHQPPVEIFPGLFLSPLELEEIFQQSCQIVDDWKNMAVHLINPEQVPLLKKTAELKEKLGESSFLTLSQLFNGKQTLWDIAVQKKQPLLVVMRTLNHFFKRNFLELKTIEDLSSPLEKTFESSASSAWGNHPSKPLIACIDDSPAVCEFLEHILLKGGYRVLKILDPIQGMNLLSKYKPDLIFLDLIMPKTSGYTVCHFLRQSPLFHDVPIIILTGQDGLIDRTRAKSTGASEFLSKSSTPEKVLQVVAKYFQKDEIDTDFSDISGAAGYLATAH